MLESTSEALLAPGGPHAGCPDKHPAVRLATIEAAGEAAVPYTSGGRRLVHTAVPARHCCTTARANTYTLCLNGVWLHCCLSRRATTSINAQGATPATAPCGAGPGLPPATPAYNLPSQRSLAE